MTSAPSPTPPTEDARTSEQAPPAPPARPQLRRSGSERMLGGVCGGLAEYSGIDTLLWRVGFVGLAVAGGSGFLIYALLWVLMPPAPFAPEHPRSALDEAIERLHVRLASNRTTPPT